MRATMNAQATQNVNFRQSNDRVAGIRTQQNLLRHLGEHLACSWRCLGERAFKRTSALKASSYWHRTMSRVQRDADAMPGVGKRPVWVPVPSVVV